MSYPENIRRKRKANLFANDLKSLMYAFGDVQTPYNESVQVLEDILEEYIVNICHEAHRVARTSGRQKIKVDDFKFALRGDHRKLGRVEELLARQREINEARKMFDNSEGKTRAYADNKEDTDKDKSNDKEKERDGGGSSQEKKKSDKSTSDPDKPRKVGRPKKYNKKKNNSNNDE